MSRREGELTTQDLVPGSSDHSESDVGDVDREEQSSPRSTAAATQTEGFEPLLSPDETESFRSRWQAIQGAFVDEPRGAAEDADRLVAELMARLAETFSEERSRLEAAWGQGDEVSTEDLRVALQRYKSFFNRLLSV
jgi:hypothetical protein